jgi:hypothetical protein
MQLKRAVLTAADRDDAIVIVSRAGFGRLEKLAKLSLFLDPVDVNLLLGRLTSLTNAELIEFHAFLSFRDAAPNAVLHAGHQRLSHYRLFM